MIDLFFGEDEGVDESLIDWLNSLLDKVDRCLVKKVGEFFKF